ncbi:hypothetical protein SteCoe_26100 [Stentor coeruleus]|uniref:Enkurin domain-containing protein n=1 Tax=Stentor coeruleus TaxID=5963 RepID=A0A1R2BDQ5_9CILI|nr:hypothetical protein SteCoe_26100 [Stentor coeruleus]
MKPTIKTQRIEKCQVAEILSEPKRLTDINYEKKNYTQLKNAQTENRKKKEELDARPPKEPFKIKRFQNVESVVYKNPEEIKKPKQVKERSNSANQPIIVTYNPDDEGQVNDKKPDNKRDYVTQNAKAAITQAPSKIQQVQVENTKTLNPSYGKVPQYIEEYKAKREEQMEKKKQDEEQAKCPPGMKLMSETERVETLAILQKGKDDVWQAINRLPIASNTLAVQKKRSECEAKLIELENAIKTFSRPKVYVALS